MAGPALVVIAAGAWMCHVVLSNHDVYFVVGHLAEGSVRVTAGQDVREGETIALVGNSEWTERPHAHMQAMRTSEADFWHGTPVPIRFGGRFLVRNQVFRAGPRGARPRIPWSV